MLNLTVTAMHNVQLSLTPELKQAIFVLQISADELAGFLQSKALDNPLLELEWPPFDFGHAPVSRITDTSAKDRLLNNVSKHKDTIESMLLAQLRLKNLSRRLYQTAAFLAGNINDAGYLDVPFAVISREYGVTEAEALEALAQLQALEPAGIGARDLRECLLLQIRRDAKRDPLAEIVVEKFLQELAKGKLKQIAGKLHVGLEALRGTLKYIRTLNPRPGNAFGDGPAPSYRLPDAIIEKVNGKYELVMTDAYLPKVAMNRKYRTYLQAHIGGDGSHYLRDQARDAALLLRCLEQRKRTLQRVIEAVIQKQSSFLDCGVSRLKPMNLKAVAAGLDLHESTVSRAVQNKYVQTPQGLYELNYFFPSGIATAAGEHASAESIKAEIRKMVDNEDKNQPLSDQQMADALAGQGISISRRTVMKYREEMRILSSRLRS